MNKNRKIFVAGHNGHVGSAIVRKLKFYGYRKILTIRRKQLDLLDQNKVLKYLKKNKPDCVIIAAARVGGIIANNNYRAEFIYENLTIQNNLIHGSYLCGIKDLIFLGSSCIYPKLCKQPQKEEYLLNGKLEHTNEPYAIAKIAGIKMCENYNIQYKTNYKCLMPTNSYGPNDNYNLDSCHFFPAIIKKVYLANLMNKKSINLLGTGKARRELIYVDDIADAAVYFMNKKVQSTLINIGTGIDYTIKQYAMFVIKSLGYKLKINFKKNTPDGTPRKVLDTSLAKKYGWTAKTKLKKGFKKTFDDFISKKKNTD